MRVTGCGSVCCLVWKRAQQVSGVVGGFVWYVGGEFVFVLAYWFVCCLYCVAVCGVDDVCVDCCLLFVVCCLCVVCIVCVLNRWGYAGVLLL